MKNRLTISWLPAAASSSAPSPQQQKEIQVLTASLKEQAAQIQTVSERLEKSRPAPRLVANDQ